MGAMPALAFPWLLLALVATAPNGEAGTNPEGIGVPLVPHRCREIGVVAAPHAPLWRGAPRLHRPVLAVSSSRAALAHRHPHSVYTASISPPGGVLPWYSPSPLGGLEIEKRFQL